MATVVVMPSFDLFIADRAVTSMEGAAVTMDAAQLRGIAERYDPSVHEAPIIIGHPQHDAPALGWISGLSFADGRLQASEGQLDPEFAAARQAGRFKKVSARFFTPTSPNNPTPGKYYLRDVGFLGAMTPAMKGLGTYSFATAADEQVVTAEISFGDMPAYSGMGIATMFRRLREWFLANHGTEVADQVLPNYDIESVRVAAQRADESPLHTSPFSFSDPQQETPPMTDAERAAIARAEKAERDLAALQASNATAAAAQAATSRHAEHVSFADGLVAASRWPAGARDVLIATLDQVAAPVGDGGCISFGDGDEAQPLHQALREQLQALPPTLSFGEVATKAAAGAGADASTNDRQMADRARAYKAKQDQAGNHISFSDAVEAVNANKDR